VAHHGKSRKILVGRDEEMLSMIRAKGEQNRERRVEEVISNWGIEGIDP